eukprot:scaffold59802_cov45-Phaeocystis_antarctica.AAC.1
MRLHLAGVHHGHRCLRDVWLRVAGQVRLHVRLQGVLLRIPLVAAWPQERERERALGLGPAREEARVPPHAGVGASAVAGAAGRGRGGRGGHGGCCGRRAWKGARERALARVGAHVRAQVEGKREALPAPLEGAELSGNRLPHPCKGEGQVRVEGGRRPAAERSNKPRRHCGSGLAAHLDLADILLLAVRVHVLPQSARIGEGLATVVEGAQVPLCAGRRRRGLPIERLDDLLAYVGGGLPRVRRLGEAGPAYEVLHFPVALPLGEKSLDDVAPVGCHGLSDMVLLLQSLRHRAGPGATIRRGAPGGVHFTEPSRREREGGCRHAPPLVAAIALGPSVDVQAFGGRTTSLHVLCVVTLVAVVVVGSGGLAVARLAPSLLGPPPLLRRTRWDHCWACRRCRCRCHLRR